MSTDNVSEQPGDGAAGSNKGSTVEVPESPLGAHPPEPDHQAAGASTSGTATAAAPGAGGEDLGSEEKRKHVSIVKSSTSQEKSSPSNGKIEEKQRRDSLGKGQRRKSMFEEKTLDHSKADGGELKETLAEFFSTAPKEDTAASTGLKPLRRPKLIYENTYRMDSKHPFSPSRVKTVVQSILDDMLSDFKYNSKTSAQKATEVAEKIRRNVLQFRYERYKICVLVTISPLNRQGFNNGFRCLWDANRDSYAVGTLRNPSIFAIAIVYGVYFE